MNGETKRLMRVIYKRNGVRYSAVIPAPVGQNAVELALLKRGIGRSEVVSREVFTGV